MHVLKIQSHKFGLHFAEGQECGLHDVGVEIGDCRERLGGHQG